MENIEPLLKRKIQLKKEFEYLITVDRWSRGEGYHTFKIVKHLDSFLGFQIEIRKLIGWFVEIKETNRKIGELIKNKRIETIMHREDKICDYFECEKLVKLRSPAWEKEEGRWKRWKKLYDSVATLIQLIEQEVKSYQRLEEAQLNVPNEELRTIVQNTPKNMK